MCGIVGMAGDLNANIERVLKPMLVFDSVRGEDSTGVAFIHKMKDSAAVVKQVGDPFVLFQEHKFENNLKRLNRAIIGHNRYATTGAVNRFNAHPFELDSIIGVHNGTISSKYKLPDHQDFKVDSQALYNSFELIGVKDTIEMLGGLNNAWSLVWWDKIDETLNFLRNKERPMFMARSEDSKQLFWASEGWIIDIAMARAGLKRGDIFSTEEDTHYSVHIDNNGVMHKPRLEIVKAKPVEVVVYQGYRKPPFVKKEDTTNVVSFPVTVPPKATTMAEKVAEAAITLADLDKPDTGKDVKKPQVPAKESALASEACYVSSIKREFETLCSCRDGNGGRYISLFDPKEPTIDIRLYPHKHDTILFDMEGTVISGQISNFCNDSTDNTATRGYYKVSPWTVTYDSDIGDDSQMTVMDHQGKFITEAQFHTAYPSCGWCSAKLSILDKNRYSTGGDCFCPACAKDTQVTEHVNLI